MLYQSCKIEIDDNGNRHAVKDHERIAIIQNSHSYYDRESIPHMENGGQIAITVAGKH